MLSPNRLRKKDLKFFESLSSLEKSHRKSSDRLKSCQKRTTVGRNDYLLAIETTNAHLKRHGSHGLPQLMQVRANTGSTGVVLNCVYENVTSYSNQTFYNIVLPNFNGHFFGCQGRFKS